MMFWRNVEQSICTDVLLSIKEKYQTIDEQ